MPKTKSLIVANPNAVLGGSRPKLAVTIYEGVWLVKAIKEQPEITLTGWRVFTCPDIGGERLYGNHFVGHNEEDNEGRVSSKIVEFDHGKMVGKTRSGRVYKLQGAPAKKLDPDASHTLQSWLSMNNLANKPEFVDPKKMAIAKSAKKSK